MVEKPPARMATAPGRPKAAPDARQVQVIAVRVPREMLNRLHAYMASVQAEHPYMRLSRADVIRTLLDKGLSSTED